MNQRRQTIKRQHIPTSIKIRTLSVSYFDSQSMIKNKTVIYDRRVITR